MNKYEALFIVNPSVEDAGIKELVQKFSDLINSDGTVEGVEEIGKKRLAYPVKKCNDGFYVLINFASNGAVIAELERNFRITDEVIKFIVIRKDEK